MLRCPNCSYMLVLLEKRRRYKCAKCGRLFLKKEIEDKEFRDRNKKQREKNKEEVRKERAREYQRNWYAKNRAKFNRYMRKYRKEHPKPKKTQKQINADQYAKFKEKIKAKARERYKFKKEEILKRNKCWRQNNKEKVKLSKNWYRLQNMEKTKQNQRIIDWRQAQRGLLLMMLGEADSGILRRIKI